jgi:hypothetical protein
MEFCAGSLLSFNHTTYAASPRTRRAVRQCKVNTAFPLQVRQLFLHVIAFGSVLGIAYQHETLVQVEQRAFLRRRALF